MQGLSRVCCRVSEREIETEIRNRIQEITRARERETHCTFLPEKIAESVVKSLKVYRKSVQSLSKVSAENERNNINMRSAPPPVTLSLLGSQRVLNNTREATESTDNKCKVPGGAAVVKKIKSLGTNKHKPGRQGAPHRIAQRRRERSRS